MKSEDYHSLMNGQNFEYSMLTYLPQSSEEPSAIKHDSAPYHNVFLKKPPKLIWIWDEIIACLQEKGIPFPLGNFKAE
jgi:hypothetical protein